MLELKRELAKKGGALGNNKSALFFIGIGIFITILATVPQGVPWEVRATMAITGMGIFLWAFEPVPMAYTSVLVMVALLLLQVTNIEVALSGFSSGALFLILAGFMMAKGVNSTKLGKRLAYYIMAKTPNTPQGVLWGIILAPQIFSLFIPATAVRTTLLLPMVVAIVASLKLSAEQENIRKMMFLGLALGTSISGIGFLPSALANILTVELIESHLGVSFYFFDWLWMAWPIWLLTIPVTWWLLVKVFPPEIHRFPESINQDTKRNLEQLGSIDLAEKKCIAILILTVLLWMTQGWHGMSLAIPALLSVVLMCMPGVGFAKWQELLEVNWDTFLLIGVTISLGNVVNNSGTAEFLAQPLMQLDVVAKVLAVPVLAVVALTIFTQVYHIFVANIATCVVTLVPIVFQVAAKMDGDPVLLAITVGLASLYGYILIIEILPAIIIHGDHTFDSRDFFRVGIWMSVAVTLITALVAATWWNWIGFL